MNGHVLRTACVLVVMRPVVWCRAAGQRLRGQRDDTGSPRRDVTAPDAGAQAGRLAVRTFWFDRRVAEALGSKFGSGAGSAPRQVVLLGAGMDTRAWRELGFPAGVETFGCPSLRAHQVGALMAGPGWPPSHPLAPCEHVSGHCIS